MNRLHPRSAVLSVARAALLGGFFGFFGGSVGTGMLGLPAFAVPLLGLFGALTFGGYALARYFRFRYELDGDALPRQEFFPEVRTVPPDLVETDIDDVLNRLTRARNRPL